MLPETTKTTMSSDTPSYAHAEWWPRLGPARVTHDDEKGD